MESHEERRARHKAEDRAIFLRVFTLGVLWIIVIAAIFIPMALFCG